MSTNPFRAHEDIESTPPAPPEERLKEREPETLESIEEAVRRTVRSRTRVYIPGNAGVIDGLESALAAWSKKGEEGAMEDVVVTQLLGAKSATELTTDDVREHLAYETPFVGAALRKPAKEGKVDVIPGYLRNFPGYLRAAETYPDVAFLHSAPPDENGDYNLGIGTGLDYEALWSSRKIVVIVNPNMPRVNGADARIPKSKVDYVVNAAAFPLREHPMEMEDDERASQIANNVADLIEDDSTLQLGIGNLPNSVLAKVRERGRKGLKLHSELVSDGIIDLMEDGTIENGTIGFAFGTQRLYSYVNGNTRLTFRRQEDVNDPEEIAKNPHMVAVNTLMQIDLLGQGFAERMGNKPVSGAGGQIDFAVGAQDAEGGKFVLAFTSEREDGGSRIVISAPEGSPVTAPRHVTQWIVTENGKENIKGMNEVERAEALIRLAAPRHRRMLAEGALTIGLRVDVEKCNVPPETDAEREARQEADMERESEEAYLKRKRMEYRAYKEGRKNILDPVFYEDLTEGREESEIFVITPELIEDVAIATGDYNPAHTNPEYANETLFRGVIMHGMFTGAKISRLLGNTLPGVGTIFRDLHMEFVGPVRPGDMLTVFVKVLRKEPKGRVILEVGGRVAGMPVVKGETTVIAIERSEAERKIGIIEEDLGVMRQMKEALAAFAELREPKNIDTVRGFLEYRTGKDGAKGAYWEQAKAALDAVKGGAAYDADHWADVSREVDKYIRVQETKLRIEKRKINPLGRATETMRREPEVMLPEELKMAA